MQFRQFMLGLVGAAALTVTIACGDARRADRVDNDTTMADRVDDSWMRERDAYIERREADLERYDNRWNEYKERANAKSRRAWDEVKEESAGMRRELSELKNSSKDNWEAAKNRMDNGWDKFEGKMKDIFGDDNR